MLRRRKQATSKVSEFNLRHIVGTHPTSHLVQLSSHGIFPQDIRKVKSFVCWDQVSRHSIFREPFNPETLLMVVKLIPLEHSKLQTANASYRKSLIENFKSSLDSKQTEVAFPVRARITFSSSMSLVTPWYPLHIWCFLPLHTFTRNYNTLHVLVR